MRPLIRNAIPALSLLAALGPVAPARAQGVISGPVVNPDNHHKYYLLDSATWTASEAAAVAMGGHLATVGNLAENNWIFDQFSSFAYGGQTVRGLWIGVNEAASENDWVWPSGEALCYTNWGLGEPANQGLDHYVYLFEPGEPRQSQWNDMWDADNYQGLPINGVVEVGHPRPPCAARCVLGDLVPGRRLVATRSTAATLTFAWTVDPAAAEYHLNAVTDKLSLLGTGPYRAPIGVAAASCTTPGRDCPLSLPSEALVFYQLLSACGPSGDEEGPI